MTEHELLEGVYSPQQFYDDTGLDDYKIYTGNVQERTAILNRLADAIDAKLEQRELTFRDKYIEFERRYIQANDLPALKEVARDWLRFRGWDFRANAGEELLIAMLLKDNMTNALVWEARHHLWSPKLSETECPMCGKIVEDGGWQHPDPECQSFFKELSAEFYLAESWEVNAEACSEVCWKEFVLLSQGDTL
jgi:hypothetical protein